MEQHNIAAAKIIENRKGDLKSIGEGITEGILKGTKKGVEEGLKKGAKAGIKEFLAGGTNISTFEDIGTIIGDIGKTTVDKFSEESINLVKRRLKAHIRKVTDRVIREIRKRCRELGEEAEDYALDTVAKSYQEATKCINEKLPQNPIFREIVEQVMALVDECVKEEIEEQRAARKDSVGPRYNRVERGTSKEKSLVQDIKESIENLSESIVTDITCRITKSIIKRVLNALKERLLKKGEKAYQRFENRVNNIAKSDKKLASKLKKSMKRMTEDISDSQAEGADFTEAIERSLTQGSKRWLEPLGRLLTPFQTWVTVGAGTVTVASASIATLDSEAPDINVSHSVQADRTVILTAQGNDNVGIELIELFVNGEMVKSCEESPCTYIGGPYPEGETISYWAIATDRAGNENQSATKPVQIADRSPPEIEVSYSFLVGGQIRFEARGVDNVEMERIELYVNGRLVSEGRGEVCTFTGGPYPEGGTVNYWGVAFDMAGNKAESATQTINIADRTPPEITEASHVLLDDNRVTFTARGYDNVGLERIELYIDGSLEAECPGPDCLFTAGPFPDGRIINYSFTAIDRGSNSRKTPLHELFISYRAKIDLVGSSPGPSLAAIDKTKMTIYISSDGGYSWENALLPGSALMPGNDIVDMAVSGDGSVIYVSVSNNQSYRSTDGGESWTTSTVIDGSNVLADVDFIAVAQDDPNYIAVCDANTPEVYISDDAGANWDTLGAVGDLTTATDLAISVEKGGNHFIAVIGVDGTNVETWYYEMGASGSVWTQATGGSPATADLAGAVAFSPNFYSDLVMTAVTGDTVGDTIDFNIYSFNTNTWNSGAFSGYPVSVEQATPSALTSINSASIALAPDYLGSDEALRISFVGLAVNGGTSGTESDGVFRLDDDYIVVIKNEESINSVAFDGSLLVAGCYDNTGVYRSTNALDGSPTTSASTSTKNPGSSSATPKVVVGIAGDTVVAGTSGPESAFAYSKDNGNTFNDLSLIDTTLAVVSDVAITPDGSIVYLLTADASGSPVDMSVWKLDDRWERIYTSASGTSDYIIRLAPDDPDTIYLADVGGTNVHHSLNGGMDNWLTRLYKETSGVTDMAIETDGDTIYVLTTNGYVSKSTNRGFTWGPPRATSLAGGVSIISMGLNRVAVGGNNGDIAWSYDGGIIWNPQTVIEGGSAMHIAGSEFTTERFIYAGNSASNGFIVRWDTVTKTSPSSIIPDTMTGSVRSLFMSDGMLFALIDNAIDGKTRLYRIISPSTASIDSDCDTIFQ